jgi:hypothetical protein
MNSTHPVVIAVRLILGGQLVLAQDMSSTTIATAGSGRWWSCHHVRDFCRS